MTIHDACMPAPAPELSQAQRAQLDALAIALSAQDLTRVPFADCVKAACASTGFMFLFDLPSIGEGAVSRVAAAAMIAEDDVPLVAFVTVDAGSHRLEVATECHGLDHGPAVARAYLDLLSV
ncbi:MULTISPECIES: hypothetical protein [unclassified Roseitalea]|uniref:hypothetical protein n=1 Tax=unclassified Roseitalea TaxID=2639107 RepID=UPI00273E1DB9|nr:MULTISPECIES: hypothetical protein [unclassified Roseitalea]